MREQTLDFALEGGAVGKVHEADGAPAYFVLVGWPDSAPRRADAQRARRLAHGVELAMQRQDQRGVFGDAQIIGRDADLLFLELGDLAEEGLWIEHHAVADD